MKQPSISSKIIPFIWIINKGVFLLFKFIELFS